MMMTPFAIDPDDLAVALIDLSSRPLSLLTSDVRDRLVTDLDAFMRCLALLQVPTLIFSFAGGGVDAIPLASIPEGQRFKHSTNNSFESPEVSVGVKETGRRTLALAGIATDVGVTLTALGALRLGYRVIVIPDLCGSTTQIAEQTAWLRLTQAGVLLVTWQALIAELQPDYTIGVGPELIATIAAAVRKNIDTQAGGK